MNRFPRIFLAVTLLVILAAVAWELRRAPIQITISGKFSPDDIAEITACVKTDLQRNILPDFSWGSFKKMPGRARLRLRYEIASIKEASPDGAVVDVKASHTSPRPSLLYVMTKRTNGWSVDKHALILGSGGGLFILRGSDSPISLGRTNSNGVK